MLLLKSQKTSSIITKGINFANEVSDRAYLNCRGDFLFNKAQDSARNIPFPVSTSGQLGFENFISGQNGYHQNVQN